MHANLVLFSHFMYNFEIVSIKNAESFDSGQKLWLLVETNVSLSVKRCSHDSSMIRRKTIPATLFENNTFIIGNNCRVSKLLLDATKDNTDNLIISISSFDDKTVDLVFDFNTYASVVEILKSKKLKSELGLMEKNERINKIHVLMKLDEAAKLKYSDRIREDLQVFFNLQQSGELQTIDDWPEDESIENELNYIENRLKAVIESREALPLFKIEEKRAG